MLQSFLSTEVRLFRHMHNLRGPIWPNYNNSGTGPYLGGIRVPEPPLKPVLNPRTRSIALDPPPNKVQVFYEH